MNTPIDDPVIPHKRGRQTSYLSPLPLHSSCASIQCNQISPCLIRTGCQRDVEALSIDRKLGGKRRSIGTIRELIAPLQLPCSSIKRMHLAVSAEVEPAMSVHKLNDIPFR